MAVSVRYRIFRSFSCVGMSWRAEPVDSQMSFRLKVSEGVLSAKVLTVGGSGRPCQGGQLTPPPKFGAEVRNCIWRFSSSHHKHFNVA